MRLVYDDSWTPTAQNQSADGTIATLLLDNGISTLRFRTFPLADDASLALAIDAEIAEMGSKDDVTDIGIATDADGDDIRSDGPLASTALVRVTGTSNDGNVEE